MDARARLLQLLAAVLLVQVSPALAALQSFAQWQTAGGEWHHKGDMYAQAEGSSDCRSFAPRAAWTDYTYELKVRKTGGAEGFLILFRVKGRDSFYWWNIGGWGNGRHALETRPRGGSFPSVNGRIETTIGP